MTILLCHLSKKQKIEMQKIMCVFFLFCFFKEQKNFKILKNRTNIKLHKYTHRPMVCMNRNKANIKHRKRLHLKNLTKIKSRSKLIIPIPDMCLYIKYKL